jgi:hypothetical protein
MLEAIKDVWPLAIIPAVIWLCVWNEERKARQRAAIAQEVKDNQKRASNRAAQAKTARRNKAFFDSYGGTR